MYHSKITALFYLVFISSTRAFIPTPGCVKKQHPMVSRAQSNSLQASLKPLSSFFSTATKSNDSNDIQSKEEAEDEEVQDNDFLLVMPKPAILNHERDYFRQATRIQAWDQYVIVSILTTSISYNALQGFALAPYHQGIFLYESIIRPLIQIVSGASCLSGVYATMVFSLSILYSRTALGSERDPQYDRFLENSLYVRIKAFRAFSLSLGLFALLVVLVLTEDLPLMWVPFFGPASLGLLYVGVQDWAALVDEATPIYLDDD